MPCLNTPLEKLNDREAAAHEKRSFLKSAGAVDVAIKWEDSGATTCYCLNSYQHEPRPKKDPFGRNCWAKVSLLAGISESAHGGLHPVWILRRFKRIIHVSCGGGPVGCHLLCDCHPRFHSRPSPLLTRISQYRWETFLRDQIQRSRQ